MAACARTGVHCCDLTGESLWVREMIDKHHAEAERTGAKIVPSCGFDSIPAVRDGEFVGNICYLNITKAFGTILGVLALPRKFNKYQW